MRKFLIALILLVIAGWLVYRNLWNLQTSKAPPPEPPPVENPPEHQPDVSTNGLKLFEEGKYKEAAKQLEREIDKSSVSEIPRLLTYLGHAYNHLENHKKAKESWQKIIKEYATSPYCGDAYYEMSRYEADPEAKVKYLQLAVEKFPQSEGATKASIDLGEYYLGSNLPEADKLFKARTYFSQALRTNPKSDLKNKLVAINEKLVFSPMPTPDSVMYSVKSGDTIVRISQQYNIPPGSDKEGQQYLGHIRRINKLKIGSLIHPDTKLKIITGKFSVTIDKSDFTLTLYLDNNFVKEYPVAIGHPTENPTPEGIYHIDTKLVNPPWTRSKENGTKERIPYGDPRNILGTRWMGLAENKTLGIHGTTKPESIGKAITNGCIRMYNKDIEEIFDLLPLGAEVIIKD